MKVNAVISEFNPFHNGHKYLVDSVKNSDDCAVVAIMSGSFVERGEASIIDKFSRAEAAVRCGCDLVLELPAPWCFSGAEFFALGGVGVADGIGVCDALVFGSESGDIEELKDCESKLSSPAYKAAVEAARMYDRSKNTSDIRREVYNTLYGENGVFSGSNNLLALEYLHAVRTLASSLTPMTVQRIGGDYNDTELRGICSASAIRNAVKQGVRGLSGYMPEESWHIMNRELGAGRYFSLSRLDTAVSAMLRASSPERLSGYMEMSGGIENRLCDAALAFGSVDEIVDGVRSRRYSASRLRRAILSAMLGVTMADVSAPPMFTVVLAANERGRKVLSEARKRSKITVISKMSDSKRLSAEAKRQFELHMRTERLYELCCHGSPEKRGAVMI